MSNNSVKAIVIFNVIFLVIVGGFWIILSSKEMAKTEEIDLIKEQMKKVEDYAGEKGFTRQFLYEGQWYANVDGKWVEAGSQREAQVMNYASRNGFTRQLLYSGQWYANVDGKWTEAGSQREAQVMNYASRNGFTNQLLYEGQWYANVDGKWVEAGSQEEAASLYEAGSIN